MKRFMTAVLYVCALVMAAVASAAAKNELPDWQDPQVVQRNRLPMSSHFETDGLKLTLNGMKPSVPVPRISTRLISMLRDGTGFRFPACGS